MNEIQYTYDQVVKDNLLQEADVLLFRHGTFPSFGWFISKYTGGVHSHAALISISQHSQTPMCVEFREMKGSRSVALNSQLEGAVDVFRLSPSITTGKMDPSTKKVLYNMKELTPEIQYQITDTAKDLTGLPYGWKIIFNIGKSYLPFVRLFYNQPTIDKNGHCDIFVCSTFVSYCIRKNYIDLIPYLPDEITKPADLAKSPYLNYMFTIKGK